MGINGSDKSILKYTLDGMLSYTRYKSIEICGHNLGLKVNASTQLGSFAKFVTVELGFQDLEACRTLIRYDFKQSGYP